MALTLPTTRITREYLVHLFYQIEVKIDRAGKRRSKAFDHHELKDAMRAIANAYCERKHAIDMAIMGGFDASFLMHQAHCQFFEMGYGE